MKEMKLNFDYYKNKKCDSIDKGIDYLRLTYNGRYDDFILKNHIILGEDVNDKIDINDKDISGIDNDNSNMAFFTIDNIDISAVSIKPKGGGQGVIFSCVYNGYSVPIFLYRDFQYRHYFDFYGSFFRLIQLEHIPEDFIYKILCFFGIKDKNIMNISRIDYRLDFFMNDRVNIPHYNDMILHNINRSNCRERKIGNKLTNWQVGDKSSKGIVYRLYDKLLDTKKKGKDFLYESYKRFTTVHRLEFECDLGFCKGYSYDKIDGLLDKIHRVFGLSEQKRIGAILYKYDTGKMVYTRKEIDRYMSYIKRDISRLNSNYLNAGKVRFRNELNPLNIITDYLIEINTTACNDLLAKDILDRHNRYLYKIICEYERDSFLH